MTRKFMLIWLFTLVFATVASGTDRKDDRHLVRSINSVSAGFTPEWNVRILGGGAYSLGEADFADLLTPAAQLSVGCRFDQMLGARISFSGWQAKGRYNYPYLDYQWNYVLSSAEIVFDLMSLFGGWHRDRLLSVNLFAGGGAAAGFRNIEAARMLRNNETFYGFEKLWTGTKIFCGARGGLELDLRLSHCLSLCLETNVIMFPDEFNSKVGKDDPFDWQFNCLVGFKFSFGR